MLICIVFEKNFSSQVGFLDLKHPVKLEKIQKKISLFEHAKETGGIWIHKTKTGRTNKIYLQANEYHISDWYKVKR